MGLNQDARCTLRALEGLQRSSTFAKVLYPYYPLFGQEFEVLGAAGGERDLIYVRLPNRTTRGVPAWMFDEAICTRVRCAERPMVDCRALLSLTHLLDSARPAPRSAGHELPPASPQKAAAAPAARSPKAACAGSRRSPGKPPQRATAPVLAPAAATAPGRRAPGRTPKRHPRR